MSHRTTFGTFGTDAVIWAEQVAYMEKIVDIKLGYFSLEEILNATDEIEPHHPWEYQKIKT